MKTKTPELTRKRLEAKIEELIELLIELLDQVDGDENLEDGGDMEPSISSAPQFIGNALQYDMEGDDSDYEENGDAEEDRDMWSNPEGLRVEVPEDARQMGRLYH